VFSTFVALLQAMVHVGAVRQTAAIVGMDRDHLRSGDKTLARLRFVRYPEYLRPGSRMVFREGRTKAVGLVAQVYHDGLP
jgi:GTPase